MPDSPRALPLFLLICASAWTQPAFAQAQGLRLQRSIAPPSKTAQDSAPLHVRGERIDGLGRSDISITGDAELRKPGVVLTADRIEYSVDTDEVEALGAVRLVAEGDEISGPRLRMRVDDRMGVVERPVFRMAPRTNRPEQVAPVEMRGEAQALRLEGEERYRAINASFTSCKPGSDDWFMRASEIDLDFDADVGEARGAQLTFKGFTSPRVPWVTFSLNNARKSGFLPPTFAVSGKTGAELVLPFYLNLAPNRDATITPRFMTQRGLQLLSEARYLEPWATGTFRFEYLPHDLSSGDTRSAFSWQQSGSWRGLTSTVNVNRVSDDNYFRDLSGRLSVATQTYLPREAGVSYPLLPWLSGGLRIQKFQTLQDLNNPVLPPYERLPQLTLIGLKQNVFSGADFGVNAEYVSFSHPTLPLGERAIAYPSLAYPIITPGVYLTPKIGLHATRYNLRRLEAATDPLVQTTTQNAPTRTLPIVSLDSGATFERSLNFRGLDLINTLEPRLYYLWVPYRDQSRIPVFDTAIADLNYAQIFSENYYVGGDRISDANQLTAAIVSRLLRSDNGQETLRGIIGQRYYFNPQRVALGSTIPPREANLSSLLLGLSGQVAPRLTMEATGQFESRRQRPERFNIGMRYQPELGKILNLGYRFTDAALNPNPLPIGASTQTDIRQIDASAQWPIGRGWYLIGRYNFSPVSRQSIETLAGFEYNGGCWVVRGVMQQFITATNTQTRQFFIQLELDGFARIGSNPLEVLRRNIPGYSLLNSPRPNRQLDLYE